MYNVVFEIILPGHSVGDDERALNDEQRDVGNEQDELDVVVAVNLGFGRIWRVTTESGRRRRDVDARELSRF